MTSLDDWHLTFVLVCTILMVAAFTPVVSAFLQRGEEPFFALAILGENGMAEHYYPEDNPNIKVESEVHWFIIVYNHMGASQYVSVRAKILNSTMAAPNSTSCRPSEAPDVYEVRGILLDNETWSHPFVWSLQNVTKVDNSTIIRGLVIDGDQIQLSVEALNGYDFRLVLELWVYDRSSDDFVYGWTTRQEPICAWNQIWFNVTSTE